MFDKFKSKYSFLLFFLGILIVIAGFVTTHYFNWPFKSEVQAYIDQAGETFYEVQSEIIYYQGSFAMVDDSLEDSQEAFYEISESRSYEESKADTTNDIEQIKATLVVVDEAQSELEKLEVPVSLLSLENALTVYYLEAEKGLSLLLEHELLQQELLEISGDELNQYLSVMDSYLNKDVSRQKLFVLFSKIADLTTVIVEQMEPLISEDDQTSIFLSVYDQHLALNEVSSYCEEQLGKGTSNGDDACIKQITDFFKAAAQANLEKERLKEEWIANSPIKMSFEKLHLLEKEVVTLMRVPLTPTPMPEISPEATDSATPTLNPSPQATPSSSVAPEASESASSSGLLQKR